MINVESGGSPLNLEPLEKFICHKTEYGQADLFLLSANDKKALSCLYPLPSNISFVRYWNPTSCDHFYTAGISEIGYGNYGYTFECIEGVISSLPNLIGSNAPLYRFYHAGMADHLYTTDYSEGVNAGYTYEGVVGYVSKSLKENYIPLYRYWNATGGDHFYTTNRTEGGGNWVYEKIACYIKIAFAEATYDESSVGEEEQGSL